MSRHFGQNACSLAILNYVLGETQKQYGGELAWLQITVWVTLSLRRRSSMAFYNIEGPGHSNSVYCCIYIARLCECKVTLFTNISLSLIMFGCCFIHVYEYLLKLSTSVLVFSRMSMAFSTLSVSDKVQKS